jgi:Nitrile hydratase, alpha chain
LLLGVADCCPQEQNRADAQYRHEFDNFPIRRGMASSMFSIKGDVSMAETAEAETKKWSKLVAQAWADDRLKQRLLTNPGAVLAEHGIEVPAGVEPRVVELTGDVRYFLLPPKPVSVMELSESELTSVAGGLVKSIELEIGPAEISPVPPSSCWFCVMF